MNLLLLLTLMVVLEVWSYITTLHVVKVWMCSLHFRPNYQSANYKWWFCWGGFQVVAATNSHSGEEWQQRQWHWHRWQQWQCLPLVLSYKWWDGVRYSHAGKKQLRRCDTPCKKRKLWMPKPEYTIHYRLVAYGFKDNFIYVEANKFIRTKYPVCKVAERIEPSNSNLRRMLQNQLNTEAKRITMQRNKRIASCMTTRADCRKNDLHTKHLKQLWQTWNLSRINCDISEMYRYFGQQKTQSNKPQTSTWIQASLRYFML